MIDTNQLSALISAFRVETEKESISPETVGKLLQDIVDLLATASTDAERQILDDWKALLSQYIVVYDVAHATGIVDMEHMFLTLKGRSMRNGATFTSSVPLSAATDMQAGVMSASHVQTLPRRSRGRACDTPVAIAATSAERTEGAARAEASLLALCRVATEEDGVNVGNAASGSAESITLR